jgi:RNA polymerase sigma factor (sigma-70 family)
MEPISQRQITWTTFHGVRPVPAGAAGSTAGTSPRMLHVPNTVAAHDHATDVPDAFERLFLREYPRVVAVAHRVLRDADAAQDAAQEAFLAFQRTGHPPDALFAAAWLHAAAAHQALNQLRGERRRLSREAHPAAGVAGASPSAAPDDPAGLVEAAETRDEVRRALARIPPRAAAVLVLRYSGLSYVEVATSLGVPANQVGTLLRRAEASLRKELNDAPPI